MTREGLNLIKHYEGCSLTAYLCPAGRWTIGYGHTSNVRKGDRITLDKAEELLAQDLLSFELNVRTRCTAPINEYQVDALTSFAYNVGVAAFSKSTLLRLINKGVTDEERIRNEFAKWVHATGKVLPGLVMRRKAEADLYFTPWYGEQHKCNMK